MPMPNHCIECDKPVVSGEILEKELVLICDKCKEKEDNTKICNGCGEVHPICYCEKGALIYGTLTGEKEMNITGMLVIGNGEKCPFCEIIIEENTDSLGHMIEHHKEQFNKVLYGKD